MEELFTYCERVYLAVVTSMIRSKFSFVLLFRLGKEIKSEKNCAQNFENNHVTMNKTGEEHRKIVYTQEFLAGCNWHHPVMPAQRLGN